MKSINVKTIFPLATLAVSILFIYSGFNEFGFWDDAKGPLGGFFPAIIGIVLACVSVVAIITSFKEAKPEFPKEDLLTMLAPLCVIISTFIIGFFPSIFIYLFVWMKIVEKAKTISAIKTSLGIGVVAYLVFSVWLKVNFPMGLFELLF